MVITKLHTKIDEYFLKICLVFSIKGLSFQRHLQSQRAINKMETFRGKSPMDYVRIQRFFIKAMDLIEDENKPTITTRVHQVFLFIWRFTMYTGVSLQDIALFTPGSSKVKLRRPFIALTISKILIKGIVFLLQKRGITEMWQQLDDQAIKTKNIGEMR